MVAFLCWFAGRVSVAPSALGAINISPLRGSARLRILFGRFALSASQARQRSTLATPICVNLRSSAVGFVSGPFVPIRVPFAAVPFSRTAGEAVGGPILGADTVMYEEKPGGIVLFFDVL